MTFLSIQFAYCVVDWCSVSKKAETEDKWWQCRVLYEFVSSSDLLIFGWTTHEIHFIHFYFCCFDHTALKCWIHFTSPRIFFSETQVEVVSHWGATSVTAWARCCVVEHEAKKDVGELVCFSLIVFLSLTLHSISLPLATFCKCWKLQIKLNMRFFRFILYVFLCSTCGMMLKYRVRSVLFANR